MERGRRCPSLYSGQTMSYSGQFNRDVDTIGGTPRPSHQLYWVSPHPHHPCAGQEFYFISRCKNINLMLSLFGNS